MAGELEVVALEGCHLPIPKFDFPHKYTEYHSTAQDESIIANRIHTADIVVTTRVRISASTISKCPNLKMIAMMSAGTDNVALLACKDRGITVCNIPAAATETVAEHALGLYFSARRNTIKMHNVTVAGKEWPEKGTTSHVFDSKAGFPRTCKNEVMGIIGGGRLGNVLANLARAVGMKVLMAERKGVIEESVRPGRTSFTDVIKQSSVIVLTCPLDVSTRNMISHPEFRSMQPDTVLINVARGGVVDEKAMVQALREGWIAGAATDVFESEPASKENSILLREYESIPNLTLSSHNAWVSETTVENLQKSVKENVEGWVKGNL